MSGKATVGRLSVVLCIVAILCQQCTCQNLIVHVQTLAKQCIVRVDNVKSNQTQFEICREWTNGREIKNWKMGAWTKIETSDHAILKKFNMHLKIKTIDSTGQAVVSFPAYYTEIKYETSVKEPMILQKITGMQPTMQVTKHVFLHQDRLYSHIHIDKIPILSFITIKNKMNVFATRPGAVISRHYITHGDIPFFLKWSKNILKGEITKSLDQYNEISLKSYCKKQRPTRSGAP